MPVGFEKSWIFCDVRGLLGYLLNILIVRIGRKRDSKTGKHLPLPIVAMGGRNRRGDRRGWLGISTFRDETKPALDPDYR